MYHVSRGDLKPELVIINAMMPVCINKHWYSITEERGKGVSEDDSINKITLEKLEANVYEIHGIDNNSLLLIAAKNDNGHFSSHMYTKDITDYSVEYLFGQDTLMEMVAANRHFVKWKGG